jgi:hypothetical protein
LVVAIGDRLGLADELAVLLPDEVSQRDLILGGHPGGRPRRRNRRAARQLTPTCQPAKCV